MGIIPYKTMKYLSFPKNAGGWVLSTVGIASFFAIPIAFNYYTANASLDGRGQFNTKDADGDEMSDEWEIYHFGSISARNGLEGSVTICL